MHGIEGKIICCQLPLSRHGFSCQGLPIARARRHPIVFSSLRMQRANERQVAIALVGIQTVADDEGIGNLKADVANR
jgi:hypothetical protein